MHFQWLTKKVSISECLSKRVAKTSTGDCEDNMLLPRVQREGWAFYSVVFKVVVVCFQQIGRDVFFIQGLVRRLLALSLQLAKMLFPVEE